MMSPNTMTWLLKTGFCIAVFLGGLPSEAKAQTGRISGVVKDAVSNSPLKGASVQMTGSSIKIDIGTISIDGGEYTIEKVPPGRYSIKVTFIGYLP